ncbi:hypothetical protein CEXT_476451 [Caerostris extrusa]|uniref:Uncharacterized protein n=1 Tax=Caerostris extrusa TaxID=172846 RepID=A0AAV4VWA4_CAEEX|nr:hypothetical protein CEXT_476451 [Caerostris extrusa]
MHFFPQRCEQTGKCDPRSAKDQNSKHDLLFLFAARKPPLPSISIPWVFQTFSQPLEAWSIARRSNRPHDKLQDAYPLLTRLIGIVIK